MKRFYVVIILAGCLAGCNWTLLRFRGQLKDLAAYSRWEDRPWGRALIFLEPMLTPTDLKEAGLVPMPAGPDLFAIHYVYHTDESGGAGESAMVLNIERNELRGVAFPPVLVEMLGERNMEALLRMAGGDSSPGSGVREVEKPRVLRALFGPQVSVTEHRTLVVTLEPREPGNRSLTLVFEEGKRPGFYGALRLMIGKPTERP